MSILTRLRQGYQAMAREVGPSTAATVAFCAALFVLALCFGCACLIGVRKTDAMFERSQVQRAFEAVVWVNSLKGLSNFSLPRHGG